MAYSALLTYSIYDTNSSEFLELIRSILEAEFVKQRNSYSKTFLPKVVKSDEYLLNPVSDKEIDPAFCSIIKAKMDGTDQRFGSQNNNSNLFVIGVLADGLSNLRKILDSIYIILNDLDVKNYIFLVKNTSGDNYISDSGQYMVKNLSTDFEVSKTMNDKEIVYGSLILQAEISETPKLNTHAAIDEIEVVHQFGENEIEVTQLKNY
jgi:hypothetical protein